MFIQDIILIWVSILFAGAPTAIISYYVIAIRNKQKPLAIAAIASCILSAFIFGLLLAIPTCFVFIAVSYILKYEEKEAQKASK